MNEKKKLTPKERKRKKEQLERIKSDISRFESAIELMEERHQLMLDNYEYTDDYEPTMKYQLLDEWRDLTKELDEFKWTNQRREYEGELMKLKHKKKQFIKQLKNRG